MRSHVLASIALALIGCGSTPEAQPAPSPSSPSVEAPPRPTPAPSDAPLPMRYGDVVALTATPQGPQTMRFLALWTLEASEPVGEVMGFFEGGSGTADVRSIGTEETPYRTLSTVGADGACVAPIRSYQMLHLHFPAYGTESGVAENEVVEAYVFEGCPAAQWAVLGPSIVVHQVSREHALPARPELASLIATADAAFVSESLLQGVVRAIEFPERDVSVVYGHMDWLVRRGGMYACYPRLLIEAGDTTLVVTEELDSNVIAELDAFHFISGSSCTVHDESGTPLTVRATPSLRADVIGTLASGSDVSVVESRGAWRRIEAPSGWVFGTALQCP